MKRQFHGIRRTDLRDAYDAIVIGAGIGGLICSNLLIREGLSVLLLDQHTQVGGYCSGFTRKGFLFDAASHFYPLLGNPETLTGRILETIGVKTQWIKMDPVDQFHLPDGSPFAVPASVDTYVAQLKAMFPVEAGALDEFFSLVNRLYLLGVLEYFRGIKTSRLDPWRELTVRDAMDRYFVSQKLKLLLTADCPHWGSPPHQTSFVFDSMLRISYFLGNYYPLGGSQKFADELASRFEECGGHILLRAGVRKIRVQQQSAIGIELGPLAGDPESMHFLAAGAVVSNADLHTIVDRMFQSDDIPQDYVQQIRSMTPTWPCFLLHLGVEGISAESLRRAHGYYWSGWDSDRVGDGDFDFKVFVPSLYDDQIAPPNCHNIVIQKILKSDFDSIQDWTDHKSQIEEFVLNRMEQIIPGFRQRIVVSLSASAKTSWRYTRNHHGAMLGWQMSPSQLGDNRPDIRFPIQNVYLTGHWTRPGGGITPVIVSAQNAASAVVRDLRTRLSLSEV